MDIEKNIQRIEAMLIGVCGCTYEQAIYVCQEAIEYFKDKNNKIKQ